MRGRTGAKRWRPPCVDFGARLTVINRRFTSQVIMSEGFTGHFQVENKFGFT